MTIKTLTALASLSLSALTMPACAATPSATPTPVTAQQVDPDVRYVIAVVTAIKINAYCPAYKVDPEAVVRDSEMNGANVKALGAAMSAAFSMANNVAYDHDALIPDVTRAMIKIANTADTDYAANPAGWCNQFGGLFVNLGLATQAMPVSKR